jgi:hypothetical protein
MGVVRVWGHNDLPTMWLGAIGVPYCPDRGTPKSASLGSMHVWEMSLWGGPASPRGACKGEVRG